MPADASPKQSKPVTRSSLRQSLGKAFADAISSKEGKEATKNAKKLKESRRSSIASVSSLQTAAAASRASMDVGRPSSQISSKRTGTPDSKSISTRKRIAGPRAAPDEALPAPAAASPPPVLSAKGTTSVRTRNLNGTSALPKYRPKSVVMDAGKPPSPLLVRAGTRRRLSTSDDEKKEQTRPAGAAAPASVAASPEKLSRPISPLPHRAALRANLTNSLAVSPPSTPSKNKNSPSSSVNNGSPTRPAKVVKITPSAGSMVPRAMSSSSLQKSSTPKDATPKAAGGLRARLGHGRSASITPSNIASQQPNARNSPSPLARRKEHKTVATASTSAALGNMSNITEGPNEDDDDDVDDCDVELLLAPVALLEAPTPAMPRIQAARRRAMPQTPTRRNPNLPSRGDMSYLSPLPSPDPTDKKKPVSMLRPPVRHGANHASARGSLMTFEHVIAVKGDEFGYMLSDTAAPFHPGGASPSMSSQVSLCPPDSPALSEIDSPGGGYGSISQVLLPDVTPSPAVNRSLLAGRFSVSPDAPDASNAAFLRMQLVSVEGRARALAQQVHAMEEEAHQVAAAHAQEREEHQAQMRYQETLMQELQAQMQAVRSAHAAQYTADLERRFEQMELEQEQAVDEALTQFAEDSDKAVAQEMQDLKLKQEVVLTAKIAAARWDSVFDACNAEMEDVQNDKAMLALFLGQLDQLAVVV